MTQAQEELIMIIRNVACEYALPDGFSIIDPDELYQLAKAHDIAHFVGYAVDKRRISVADEGIRKAFRQ